MQKVFKIFILFMLVFSMIDCAFSEDKVLKTVKEEVPQLTNSGNLNIKIEWKWSQNKLEIYNPKLSDDNKEIAFITQIHWPDGVEAESIDEKEMKELSEKKKANERFSDPEINIINLANNALEKIQWGWTPSFSHDGTKIVYAYQVKPLSGFRHLAETMSGNEITEYDRNTKQSKKITSPKSGYFSDPVYSSDGKYIYFNWNKEVNGAYGGKVGEVTYEISTGDTKINRNFEKKDINISPDGTMSWKIIKDSENYNTHLRIYIAQSKYEELNAIGDIEEVSWAKDSKRLIIVDTRFSDRESYRFSNDEIIILKIE